MKNEKDVIKKRQSEIDKQYEENGPNTIKKIESFADEYQRRKRSKRDRSVPKKVMKHKAIKKELLTYDIFKGKVIEHIWKLMTPDRQMSFRSENKLHMVQLIKWFMNETNGDENLKKEDLIPCHKDIWMYGNIGTCKTTVIRAMNLAAQEVRYQYENDLKVFAFVPFEALLDKIQDRRDPTIANGHFKYNTIYDDFAHMGRSGKVSFRDINVPIRIVRTQYRSPYRAKKIFISNHHPDQLTEHFGDAIFGRLMDLCWIVDWKGMTNEYRPGATVSMTNTRDGDEKF